MAEQPYAGMTVPAAQAAFFAHNGMPGDGGYTARTWSLVRGTPAALPNFAWRQRAIALHDLHHILTGFPCTVIGEFEMAAWEFAAGPFPDRRAAMFCLPLVGLGALVAPRRTFAAFVLGRQSRTLYRHAAARDLSGATVDSLRAEFLPARIRRARAQDRGAYCSLVARAVIALVLPAAPLVALVFCMRG